MSWLVESIIAVAFHDPVADGAPDALQPWLRAFKTNPQNYQSSLPGQPSAATAVGVVGEFQAALTAQLGRLELGLTSPMRDPEGISHIEDFETALQLLKSYFSRIAEPMGHQRLALVINASQRAPSQAEALRFLRNEVQLADDLPDSAVDIQLRFNVPRSISDGSLTINRLATWSVGAQQIFMMQVTPGSAAPSTSIKELHAAVLNVDVNTAPITPTTGKDVGTVFDELTADASAMIKGGYAYLIR